MQMLPNTSFKNLVLTFALGSAALGLWAQENKAVKVDPTGAWKWTSTNRDGQVRETTLKLKLDADKLVGTITGRDGTETALENGALKGEDLSFQVTRERNGQKFTIKYQGKISGDSIQGSTESGPEGQRRTRDWAAKRAGDPAGTWKWSYTRGDGTTMDFTLKLKCDGEKLTGTSASSTGREATIEEGKFKDGEVSFQVTRERDGQKFTAKYRGKLEGDSIAGKAESNFGGQNRTFDWNPKRAKD